MNFVEQCLFALLLSFLVLCSGCTGQPHFVVVIQYTGVAMPFPLQKDVRPMHYVYVVRREEGIRVTDLISSSYKVLA